MTSQTRSFFMGWFFPSVIYYWMNYIFFVVIHYVFIFLPCYLPFQHAFVDIDLDSLRSGNFSESCSKVLLDVFEECAWPWSPPLPWPQFCTWFEFTVWRLKSFTLEWLATKRGISLYYNFLKWFLVFICVTSPQGLDYFSHKLLVFMMTPFTRTYIQYSNKEEI